MSTFYRWLLACMLAISWSHVAAEDVGDMRLSFGASSLGPTTELSYRFHPSFSVRAVAGGGVSLNGSVEVDRNSYDVNFSPAGAGVLLDWHTGLGGLRVSGGVFYADPQFEGSTTAASAVVINGVTYTGTDTVEFGANVENEVAPAVTLGYDQAFGDRWVISAEAGALFNGGYSAYARSTTGVIPQADLDAEARSIEQDLNEFGAYPYVSIMLGLRF